MAKQNPFKPIVEAIPVPLRNKYTLVVVFFMFWMVFIDKHDFVTQWKLDQTYTNLKKDKKFYEEGIEELKAAQQDLANNKEKFAREKYYMKKKNEDVYVIK